MPYPAGMHPSPDARKAFSNWLKAARKERYTSQRAALAAMAEQGILIDKSEYSEWEGGSRVPREDNPKREQLYAFFGSRPEDQEPQPARDALANAIERQAAAIEEQNRLNALQVRAIEENTAAVRELLVRLGPSFELAAELASARVGEVVRATEARGSQSLEPRRAQTPPR